MLKKVISGGQTGADRTGLEVAKYSLGLKTGGHVPKGCRTDEGPDPSLVSEFGCEEDASSDYPPRTYKNAANSDMTVWFGGPSSGFNCTQKACIAAHKILLVNPSGEKLRQECAKYQVQVLNVAGNRRSKNPSVVKLTRDTLLEAFL